MAQRARILVRSPMSARESNETVSGEIRKSLSELRTIIDTIPALAWSSAPEGSVDFVNRRPQDYNGQSREQSQGAWLGDRDPSRRPSRTAEQMGGGGPAIMSPTWAKRGCDDATAYSGGSSFVANLYSAKVVRSLDGLEQDLILDP